MTIERLQGSCAQHIHHQDSCSGRQPHDLALWRRLRISGFTSLAQFHHVNLVTMGWDDDYLYKFQIYGK